MGWIKEDKYRGCGVGRSQVKNILYFYPPEHPRIEVNHILRNIYKRNQIIKISEKILKVIRIMKVFVPFLQKELTLIPRKLNYLSLLQFGSDNDKPFSRIKHQQVKSQTFYKVHEVQFIRMNDPEDQFKQLLESSYYSDTQQGREKFMENKLGFQGCQDLKHKLGYVMRLHEKEIYQQKKIQELLEIAVKHMDSYKERFSSLPEKKQKDFLYFLKNLYDLIVYLNIIDINLYRSFVESIVLVSKQWAFTYQFSQLLQGLDAICKQFYNEGSDLFRKKSVFRSSELSTIISGKLIRDLLKNFGEAQMPEQAKAFVIPLFSLSSIIWKVQKCSSAQEILVSGFHKQECYAKFQEQAIKFLPTLEIDLALSLYYSFSVSGIANENLSQEFYANFIKNIKELSKDILKAQKIIDIMANIGKGSQKLYDLFEETQTIQKILQSGGQSLNGLQQKIKVLSLGVQSNIIVKESTILSIVNEMSNLTENQINQLSQYNIEVLTRTLIFLSKTNPNMFMNTGKYQSSQLQALVNQAQSTFEESIQKILNQLRELNKENQVNPSQEDSQTDSQNSSMQGYKQEQLCRNSLEEWLVETGLSNDIVVLSNQKIGSYEIDLLIYSKSLDKMVAIEISGMNYTNSDGSLVGKRILKNNVLKVLGLDVKYFSVTQEDIFHNHIANSLSRKTSRTTVATSIFDLVQQSFNHYFIGTQQTQVEDKNQTQKRKQV